MRLFVLINKYDNERQSINCKIAVIDNTLCNVISGYHDILFYTYIMTIFLITAVVLALTSPVIRVSSIAVCILLFVYYRIHFYCHYNTRYQINVTVTVILIYHYRDNCCCRYWYYTSRYKHYQYRYNHAHYYCVHYTIVIVIIMSSVRLLKVTCFWLRYVKCRKTFFS